MKLATVEGHRVNCTGCPACSAAAAGMLQQLSSGNFAAIAARNVTPNPTAAFRAQRHGGQIAMATQRFTTTGRRMQSDGEWTRGQYSQEHQRQREQQQTETAVTISVPPDVAAAIGEIIEAETAEASTPNGYREALRARGVRPPEPTYLANEGPFSTPPDGYRRALARLRRR